MGVGINNMKHYDYLGNEIKEGMTLKVIRTRVPYVVSGYWNGSEHVVVKEEPKPIWECIQKAEVIRRDNRLMYKTTFDNETWYLDLAMLFPNQPCDLITIEGVSDKKPCNNK